MSTENSTEGAIAPISDTAKATEATKSDKAEKPSTPMSFKEKLCLNVSIIAIVMAVLQVTGLIGNLPNFLWLAVKEKPVDTFFVSVFATLFLTAILSSFMPRQISVVGRLPLFMVGGFWLIIAWKSIIESYPATLGNANPLWVLIATMVFGFCAACHWDSKATTSGRIEAFTWAMLIANVIALFLIFSVVAGFINSVKGSLEAKIESAVDVQQRMEYIWGTCPEVKSKEYCDALKIITSR